ncbi:hypothetical protein HHK36_020927 [Tetracentron sinense]|uniref:Pentatricopeptide repeat-containing protein n=1 Tax=Tetracentron sinense TaxID=13715 RepID=A0A834YW90_TETSI|nr:hypothetical protein HHK36_020927 [Tetracentron sinense]
MIPSHVGAIGNSDFRVLGLRRREVKFTKLVSTSHIHPISPTIRHLITWAQIFSNEPDPPILPRGPAILATNLIKSYCEKGLLKEARRLFDEIPERDVVAWTAMISGYTSCGCHAQAWMVFIEMTREGIDPNAFTTSSVLTACKGMNSCSCRSMVHGLVIKHGMDIMHHIHVKNAVSWTTMISGYTHRGDGHSGLRVFRQMLQEEVELNPFSCSIAIRACASIESHSFGKQVHSTVIKHGFESNLPVSTSIVDMYCRCNSLSEASRFFHEMSQRDLITWNTLIAGFERSDSSMSLYIFSQMGSEDLSPNSFTLTSVVTACANLAVLNCGQQEIYGCVVDLLGRAGRVKEAYELIAAMPFEPDEFVWGVLLGACKVHRHPNLGRLAAWKLLDLRPIMTETYVILSNIYAADGKWGEFAKMRKLMRGMGSKKETGRS